MAASSHCAFRIAKREGTGCGRSGHREIRTFIRAARLAMAQCPSGRQAVLVPWHSVIANAQRGDVRLLLAESMPKVPEGRQPGSAISIGRECFRLPAIQKADLCREEVPPPGC